MNETLAIEAASAAPKPNILLIYTDDQTFDSIHALGNAEIQTPNLDRLAKAGTSFANCYNLGGWHGAICVASRTIECLRRGTPRPLRRNAP